MFSKFSVNKYFKERNFSNTFFLSLYLWIDQKHSLMKTCSFLCHPAVLCGEAINQTSADLVARTGCGVIYHYRSVLRSPFLLFPGCFLACDNMVIDFLTFSSGKVVDACLSFGILWTILRVNTKINTNLKKHYFVKMLRNQDNNG